MESEKTVTRNFPQFHMGNAANLRGLKNVKFLVKTGNKAMFPLSIYTEAVHVLLEF